MNAYDLLAEIGGGSVQRDARRHVLGHESLTARHPTAQEFRRDARVDAVRTRFPRWHGVNLRSPTTMVAATWVVIGSTLVRAGRRVQGATGPDAAPGSPVPAGKVGGSR
jgi:hypothetical protein